MLKNLLFCFFILTLGIVSSLRADPGSILNEKGNIRPEVLELFRVLEPWIRDQNNRLLGEKISTPVLERVFLNKPPVSLADLNAVAQRLFLRGSDSLAHQKKESLRPYRALLQENFRKIGNLITVVPSQPTYTYLLLAGGTVPEIRLQLETLAAFIQNKEIILTPSTQVVFLTAERPLEGDEEIQELDALPVLKRDPQWLRPSKLPTTEHQATEWVWEQTPLPEALRQLKPVFVVAETKISPLTAKEISPVFFDKVKKWTQTYKLSPGSCLLISHQPFVYLHQMILLHDLKKMGQTGLSIEGVGRSSKKLESEEDLDVLLDTLARVISLTQEQAQITAPQIPPPA